MWRDECNWDCHHQFKNLDHDECSPRCRLKGPRVCMSDSRQLGR